MNPLRSFIIPVRGLKIGVHTFDFQLDKQFFKAFNPDSDVQANLKVELSFDKRHSMYILDMIISGTLNDACDRCLEQIDIPVYGEHQLYLKRGQGEEEADLVYLENFDDEINIAEYIYDFALLSFPIMKVIDCDEMEKPPCNMELLDKWDSESQEIADDEEKPDIWEKLNKLNLDK